MPEQMGQVCLRRWIDLGEEPHLSPLLGKERRIDGE